VNSDIVYRPPLEQPTDSVERPAAAPTVPVPLPSEKAQKVGKNIQNGLKEKRSAKTFMKGFHWKKIRNGKTGDLQF